MYVRQLTCHRGSSCHLRYPSLREEYIRYHHVHSARAQNHELVPGLSHGLQSAAVNGISTFLFTKAALI